ncbi:MAG: helix-turn-helix domain-containing protein [Christensenellales bacterium]|jgi:transcriptional regulator with XRE-family HTH domain
MTEQLRVIGQRMQAQREALDITQQDMAQRMEMDLKEYQQYENGELDFSFSFLYTAADVLGIDVMDLMSGDSPKLSMCTVIRKGEGVSIERIKAYKYQHLAYTFRDKKGEPFLVTAVYDPEKKLPKLNTHEGQEFDYVLKGKLRVSVGGREYILCEGDSIYYDSSYPHAMQAVDEDAEFLAVVMK